MELVLEMLSDFVGELHGVVAGPLTTRLAAAAAGRPHVGTGTAEVETKLDQFREDGLKGRGLGAQKDDVPR